LRKISSVLIFPTAIGPEIGLHFVPGKVTWNPSWRRAAQVLCADHANCLSVMKASNFPLGKAPLVMAILMVVSALSLAVGHQRERKTLTLWVFARTHYDDYMTSKAEFERQHPGWKVEVKLTDGAALVNRLLAAFIAGRGAPDVTEVEISSIGRFFKGPIEEIGFVDLTERFRREGYLDAIPAARFTPWMTRGHIFGCPEDLHPVILLYREDLFRRWDARAHGWVKIDLPKEVKLWSDFVRVGQEVMRDSDARGEPVRYPIALFKNQWWSFWILLLQRGGGMFDERGNVIIDQPVAVDTLQFLTDLFNKGKIAWPVEDLPSLWAAANQDQVMSVLAPDWFVGFVKDNCSKQAGKWRAMPLPAFEPGGRRVSSHGGTTMCIPKQCPNPEMAWELIRFFYLNHDVVVERVPKTRVMPALNSAYTDRRLLTYEDPFLGGQRVAALFGSLKDDIPRIHQTPYWAEAQVLLQQAVFNAIEGYQTPQEALGRIRRRLEKDVGRYRTIEGELTAR